MVTEEIYRETCYICRNVSSWGTMNFCWVFSPDDTTGEHYTDIHICTLCLNPKDH